MRRLAILAAIVASVAGGDAARSGVPCGADVINFSPVFSADSQRVAFLSGGGGGCVPHGQLLVAAVAGGGLTTVSSSPDAAPVWSPDGTRLAYEAYPPPPGGTDAQVVVARADGSGAAPLTSGFGPSWSQDGTRLAFYRPDGVYVTGADGSGIRRLGDGAYPSWSPVGEGIALVNHGVVFVRSDGSGMRTLTTIEARPPLLWSPDGTRIAFATYADPYDVVVVGFTGQPVRTTQPAPQGSLLGWSPDGDRLLLSSGWTIRADGGVGGRLVPEGQAVLGVSPDWHHLALPVVAGRAGYPGLDLYVSDGAGLHPRRISPARCSSAFGHCIEGTDGPDTITGSDEYDIVYGRAGDDRIYGRGGANHLEGAFGRDLLVGGPRNDVIEGQMGSDHLIGDAGIDILDGGPGDDVIDTGRGQDYASGDLGDDRIYAADGWPDSIDCGPGNDTAIVDSHDHPRNCEHVRVVRR